MALYLFWGPPVIWALVLAALVVLNRSAPVRVNVVAVFGALMGLAAVTIAWDFEPEMLYGDSPTGIFYFAFASWFCLLSPLAGFGGVFALWIDWNSAQLYGYEITGDGYLLAVIATVVVLLSAVVPVFVKRGEWPAKKTLRARLLTVQVKGFRFKEWSRG